MIFDDVPSRLRLLPSWLMVQAANRAAGLVAERAAAIGVVKAAFPALAALDQFGATSQAELGRRLALDRKDVSLLAAELERTGMVRRGPDPTDVRRNCLEITPSGQAMLAQLDVAFSEVQDVLLMKLSEEDRTTLLNMLTKIVSP